ncbi:copper chaperone CopZ [Priestia filamentosa]|uniref:Copper chaperone CopZ n=1 Tax=Priestia filamentosa TaxID=1402861 RepID=A0A1X7CPP4_9BACI|nr:copper chaperone CopZ [Priestia filamentosa]AKO94448.1 copper resistance protein CopZ [Priestia filamentosa]MDT3764743.1 copper chaperone CopZ [Priestia filamentosa]OXS70815.1 copper resistance protein CopZ [Priestia filamentosa]RJS66446.1 copper resistance protein CopZ [Priestia filamentosa]WCM15344.1 copper chaperone CopZ [Priestia filamentosa]
MEKVTLNVEGMSCNHCVKAIESSVGELNGVEKVDVNLNEKAVTVEFDKDKATLDEIKETIDDQGYDVK